jgi:hypothetical protein
MGSLGTLLARQRQVAVAFLSADFAAEPGWRFEFSAACLTRKFYFGDNQSAVPSLIDIDLDRQILPGHFIAHLVQTTAPCRRPQDIKLFRANSNLALLTRRGATDFKCERGGGAFFSQTHVPPIGFIRQIALRDPKMATPPNVGWEVLDQEFSLDLLVRNVMWSHWRE